MNALRSLFLTLVPATVTGDEACRRVARDTLDNTFTYLAEDTRQRCGRLCELDLFGKRANGVLTKERERYYKVVGEDFQEENASEMQFPRYYWRSDEDDSRPGIAGAQLREKVKNYYQSSITLVPEISEKTLSKPSDKNIDPFLHIYKLLGTSPTEPVNCTALFTDPYGDCHLVRFIAEESRERKKNGDKVSFQAFESGGEMVSTESGPRQRHSHPYRPPFIWNLPHWLRRAFSLVYSVMETPFYLDSLVDFDPEGTYLQDGTVLNNRKPKDNVNDKEDDSDGATVWSEEYVGNYLSQLYDLDRDFGVLKNGERYSDVFGSKRNPGKTKCFGNPMRDRSHLGQRGGLFDESSTPMSASRHALPIDEQKQYAQQSPIGPCPSALCSYSSTILKTLLYLTPRVPKLIGGHVVIVGSQTPWLEAIALYSGAKSVTTVEYNKLKCNHPKHKCYTPGDFARKVLNDNLKFDAALTFSSLEHSGLGRYGDPLNPWGDFMSLAKIHCTLKQGAGLLLNVPYGIDTTYFNAHRAYGGLRLPLLVRNWELVSETVESKPQKSIVSNTTFTQSNVTVSLLLNCSTKVPLATGMGRSDHITCALTDKPGIRRELEFGLRNRFSGHGYMDDRIWIFRKRDDV